MTKPYAPCGAENVPAAARLRASADRPVPVRIAPRKLSGQVWAPQSKSDAHRLLIACALSCRPCIVHLRDPGADVEATLRCLRALGAAWERRGEEIRIEPIRPCGGVPELRCGESASTLRFLLPAAALFGGAVFAGSGRLPERPLRPLLDALRANGCAIPGDTLPIYVPGGLRPGRYELPGNISSQFVSGLLFALPLLRGDSDIALTAPLESGGYVRMTMDTLSRFGVRVECVQEGFHVPGGQKYEAAQAELCPEGDWSGAAFWLAVNALGSRVKVLGLRENSAQPDRCARALAERLPDRVDVRGIPDLAPALCAMACGKKGDTLLEGAVRLRTKESDRLAACVRFVRALGGCAETDGQCLLIRGSGTLRGGVVDGAGDHRIVMAASCASCICLNEVILSDARPVLKSYPAFFEDFTLLGGDCRVI